ncbi:MAG TPA: histidine ammonia-lyase [Polyangia bacterium]|nr:histidine ammonia-lyase [Armatimonadota bacterium]HUT78709.1 histidine ammonia-lyase [Polyangia bacterium]
MARDLEIRPGRLTLGTLRELEGAKTRFVLSEDARAAIRASKRVLDQAIEGGRRIYGVTTGAGPLAGQVIGRDLMGEMQRRLVLSNAVGVGAPLSPGVTRRVMLLKIATLAAGASGVGEALADRLVAMLNADLLPVIPAKGSVGASGDLAPLAHLGVCLLGEGDAYLRGERMPAARALAEVGLAPLVLEPKEGLAIVNGTQVSTALAIEGLFLAESHLAAALACGALSVEAGSGTAAAFDPRIHDLRAQIGQAAVADVLRTWLAGSGIQADRPVARVQDPYSLRCMPQVMGAVLDQIAHVASILGRELRAVTDNPLIDPASGDLLFGGNFHAQPVGMVADNLALALAETGSMSERRTAFLVDQGMSGLPAFLVAEAGLNTGFMVAQVTAAALASENKAMAHPGSIDSIPTAANQEDYVSMATYAARRLGDMAENLGAILAIELLAAAQGLDLRRPLRSSPALEALHGELRETVPAWDEDRYFAPDVDAARAVLASGAAMTPEARAVLPSFGAA